MSAGPHLTREESPTRTKRPVELGLELMAGVAVPGVAYSQQEIAEWCGCHRENIAGIERRALWKLRRRAQELAEEVR